MRAISNQRALRGNAVVKAVISRAVSSLITSPGLRQARRAAADLRRRMSGARAVVHYFHQDADPYSRLAAQALPQLADHYDIRIEAHRVSPPAPGAAPDPERLAAWAARDACRLAVAHGFDPEAPADDILEAFQASTDLAAGDALLERLGHYQGGMFHFDGEWFWGLDRLHYLERRLRASNLAREGAETALVAPPRDVMLAPAPPPRRTPVLHMFPSFRSPYTYIALPRAQALAQHYGAELRIRFVLPMVMRGLPVPRAKSRYITLDTKREAERLDMPFGRIVDPVGLGVERGLAVLHHAIPAGRGCDFALSFLQGAFAEGIDATTDAGLGRMVENAGLSTEIMTTALADESWRDVAEANRQEMLAAGLWGVPSFRVDDGEAVWGQDRLWAVEEDLRVAAAGEIT